jgi:hypothetical protein
LAISESLLRNRGFHIDYLGHAQLTNEGKYVVVHGETIAGPFDTYEDALQAGYDKFGVVPFLVKRISRVEPIQYFSRDLPTCPS